MLRAIWFFYGLKLLMAIMSLHCDPNLEYYILHYGNWNRISSTYITHSNNQPPQKLWPPPPLLAQHDNVIIYLLPTNMVTFLYYVNICDLKKLVHFGHKKLRRPQVANVGSCNLKEVVASGHNKLWRPVDRKIPSVTSRKWLRNMWTTPIQCK